MTILITGATGLIGSQIVKQCLALNYTVHYLTTSKAKLVTEPNYKGFYWNPKANDIDTACFNTVTVIINLVGATIAKRWTPSYKDAILKSRTETAKLLYTTIKAHNFPVKHIVSASAIGIYPSSFTNVYKEDFAKNSTSFLGDVVDAWEAAVNCFSELNIAVAKIRIGLVLAKNGGALPEIVKPTRLGFGAAFGTGKHWQSWIHVNDLASLFLHVVQHNLTGVYNGVAPNPVSNSQLTRAVAKVLAKPLWLPNIPKFAMKLVLGNMHILLFESQRVCSKKIEDSGFQYQFTNIQPAIKDLLL